MRCVPPRVSECTVEDGIVVFTAAPAVAGGHRRS
jgi:hypothetical protein